MAGPESDRDAEAIMPALTEFLEERAQELAKVAPTRESQLDEWRTAVAALFAQCGEWLAAADPRNLIRVSHGTIRRHERRLGAYEVPILRLELDGDTLTFAPSYRFGGGSVKLQDTPEYRETTGMVGVYSGEPNGPLADGRRQDEIHRVGLGADSIWGLRSRFLGRDDVILYPLIRERFEQLVVGELR